VRAFGRFLCVVYVPVRHEYTGQTRTFAAHGASWDHIIRDQEDMNRHIDHTFCNLVKHSLTANLFHRRYSSLGECFENDYYASGWSVKERLHLGSDYGEGASRGWQNPKGFCPTSTGPRQP
jgi:hypothetical protein